MKPSETFLIRVWHRAHWKKEKVSKRFETYSDIVNFVFTIDDSMDKLGIVAFPIILLGDKIKPDTVDKVNEHFLFEHTASHQTFIF